MRKGETSVDLTGRRFGHLVVEGRTERPKTVGAKDRNSYWRCRCDCGGVKMAASGNLRCGNTTHCGCRTLANKQKAGRARAKNLLNDAGKSRVAGYKTPGGDNAVNGELDSLAKERVCPHCKKVFDQLSPDWVYRRVIHGNTRWYCSYSCWRAEDAQRKTKRHYAMVAR